MMNIIGILLVCTTFTSNLIRDTGIFVRDSWFDLVELLPDNPYPFVKTITTTPERPLFSASFPPAIRTFTTYTSARPVPTIYQNITTHTIEGFHSGSYSESLHSETYSKATTNPIIEENVEFGSPWVLSRIFAVLCLSIWLYYFRSWISASYSRMRRQKSHRHYKCTSLSGLGITQPLTTFLPCQSCRSRAKSPEQNALAEALLKMAAYLETREEKIRELEAALTPVVKPKRPSRKNHGSTLNSTLHMARLGSSNPESQAHGQADSIPAATQDNAPVAHERSTKSVIVEPSIVSGAAKETAAAPHSISAAADEQKTGREVISVDAESQGSSSSGKEAHGEAGGIPKVTVDRKSAESVVPSCSVDAAPQRSSDLGKEPKNDPDSISVTADEQQSGGERISADAEPERSSQLDEEAPEASDSISVTAKKPESGKELSLASAELKESKGSSTESQGDSSSISVAADEPQVGGEPLTSSENATPQRSSEVEEPEASDDDELYTIEPGYQSPFKHCQKCRLVVTKASNPGQLCGKCQDIETAIPRSDVPNDHSADINGSGIFVPDASNDAATDPVSDVPATVPQAAQQITTTTSTDETMADATETSIGTAGYQDAQIAPSASTDVDMGDAVEDPDADITFSDVAAAAIEDTGITTTASSRQGVDAASEARVTEVTAPDPTDVDMADTEAHRPLPPFTAKDFSFSMSFESSQYQPRSEHDPATSDSPRVRRGTRTGRSQRSARGRRQPPMATRMREPQRALPKGMLSSDDAKFACKTCSQPCDKGGDLCPKCRMEESSGTQNQTAVGAASETARGSSQLSLQVSNPEDDTKPSSSSLNGSKEGLTTPPNPTIINPQPTNTQSNPTPPIEVRSTPAETVQAQSTTTPSIIAPSPSARSGSARHIIPQRPSEQGASANLYTCPECKEPCDSLESSTVLKMPVCRDCLDSQEDEDCDKFGNMKKHEKDIKGGTNILSDSRSDSKQDRTTLASQSQPCAPTASESNPAQTSKAIRSASQSPPSTPKPGSVASGSGLFQHRNNQDPLSNDHTKAPAKAQPVQHPSITQTSSSSIVRTPAQKELMRHQDARSRQKNSLFMPRNRMPEKNAKAASPSALRPRAGQQTSSITILSRNQNAVTAPNAQPPLPQTILDPYLGVQVGDNNFSRHDPSSTAASSSNAGSSAATTDDQPPSVAASTSNAESSTATIDDQSPSAAASPSNAGSPPASANAQPSPAAASTSNAGPSLAPPAPNPRTCKCGAGRQPDLDYCVSCFETF